MRKWQYWPVFLPPEIQSAVASGNVEAGMKRSLKHVEGSFWNRHTKQQIVLLQIKVKQSISWSYSHLSLKQSMIQSYSYLSLSQSIKQSYSKIKQKQTITDTVLL